MKKTEKNSSAKFVSFVEPLKIGLKFINILMGYLLDNSQLTTHQLRKY